MVKLLAALKSGVLVALPGGLVGLAVAVVLPALSKHPKGEWHDALPAFPWLVLASAVLAVPVFYFVHRAPANVTPLTPITIGCETPTSAPLKLDLEIGLERCLGYLAAFSLLSTFSMLIMTFERGLSCAGTGLAVSVAASLIFLGIRSKVDDYYELDPARQELVFRWNVLGLSGGRRIVGFRELVGAGVISYYSRLRDMSPPRWEYAPCLICSDARVIQVGNFAEQASSRASGCASGMASLLGVPYYARQHELYLRADCKNGQVRVFSSTTPHPSLARLLGFQLCVAALAGFVAACRL